jgi:hypothetical protein
MAPENAYDEAAAVLNEANEGPGPFPFLILHRP